MSSASPTPPAPSQNTMLTASYAVLVVLWVTSQVVYIPYVVHLLILVTAILYAGCHASLVLRQESRPASIDPKTGETIQEAIEVEVEVMRSQDAYQFPLWGSLSLFGLYLAFRFVDKDVVNLLIGVYFGLISVAAVTLTLSALVEPLFGPAWTKPTLGFKEWNVSHKLPEFLLGPSPLDLSWEASRTDLIALAGGGALVGAYFWTSKIWFLNNLLAICFCLQGIERFSLGTYKIGAILLVGLFFYDIFWVFGTDVMVTVAKNVDGPIKLLFPRESLDVNPDTGKLDLSLLGLGDIVIPGFFLALLLRFDAHRANVPVQDVTPYAVFAKPYFTAGLVAYCLGLGTTLFVMMQFNAAQPALLYLVPACLGSSFLLALARGEVGALLAYSEELEEEDEDGEQKNAAQATPSESKKGQ